MGKINDWLSAVFLEESRSKPDSEPPIQTFCKAALFAADDLHSSSDRAEAIAFMAHISLHIDPSFQIDHEYLPYLRLAWRLDPESVRVTWLIIGNYGTDPDDHTDIKLLKQALDCLARRWSSIPRSKRECIRDALVRLQNIGIELPKVLVNDM